MTTEVIVPAAPGEDVYRTIGIASRLAATNAEVTFVVYVIAENFEQLLHEYAEMATTTFENEEWTDRVSIRTRSIH